MSSCGLARYPLRIGLRWLQNPASGGTLEPVGEVGGVVSQTTAMHLPPALNTSGPEPRRSSLGRGLLTVEGLTIGVLGGVALASSMGYARFDADGMPMLGLKVTPPHAVLLLVMGTLALLACLGSRAALIFSALTAFGWAALTVVCAFKAAHHAPGVLGFDPRDSFLYGALSAYNLVTSFLLAFALFRYRRQS